MSVTLTFWPDTDGTITEFTPQPSAPSYACVDESSPSFSDSCDCTNLNSNAKFLGFLSLNSGNNYADVPTVPWDSIKIEAYIKVINSTRGTLQLKFFLKVGGTYYYGPAFNVTSTSGAYYSYTWNTPPWSTTGMINWGYAPSEIEWGLASDRIVPPLGSPYKENDVANIKMECTHPDHTPETPTTPSDGLVSTYNSEIQETDGEANPTDLVTWKPKFSCISNMSGDDCCGVRVRIGSIDSSSSSGNDDIFEGDFFFTAEVTDGNRTPKDDAQYDGGTGSGVLQDGVTYYWDIATLNEWGDASNWLDGGYFEGVTDHSWWDADYNRRFNLRAGTDHDALGVGYTRKATFSTGYGQIVSTTAKMNEAVQHSSRQIAYHDGYYYAVWLDTPTLSSTMRVYISKMQEDEGEWSAATEVHDTGSYIDTHKYPSILVTPDEHLLVTVGGHNSQSVIYRSTYAHDSDGIDITAWGSMQSPTGLQHSTYCRMVKVSTGDIFIFYRYYASHPGFLCYIKSTDDGATWGNIRIVIWYNDFIESQPSVYCGGCIVDDEDRVHILISWWDDYGGDNKGRAISYIYSDLDSDGYFNEFYELEGGGTKVGEVTTSVQSVNADYGSCSKIATCTNPDSTLSGDFVHTNSEALALDDNNSPIIIYYYYATVDGQGEETPIFVATWGGSSWDIVDTYTDEGLAKLWKYRQGGQLYYDDGVVHIYGFVKPSGETWFGGELYQWRWNIDTDSWAGFYMAKNTGVGIGMLSVLQYPVNGKRPILFVRGEDLVFMYDQPTVAVRYDGDDVRIVEADYNNGTPSYTEIDRLPVAFQMNETHIYFALNTAIPANTNAPTDKIYQVYIGKHDATNPPRDYETVFRFLENFENYSSNSQLDGQGGWSVDTPANMMVFDSTDITNYGNAHTNKLWDGDNFLKIQGAAVATWDLGDSLAGLGTDITAKKITFHIWDEGGSGRIYVELYDVTASKYVRFGFDFTGYAGYMTSGTAWSNVVTLGNTRYYIFELTIDENGVSGYVNGTTVFTNDTEIAVFDYIRIGGYNGTPVGIFDQLMIVDWVANGPEETTTEDYLDVKDLVGSARLAHKVVPTLIGSERQSQLVSAVKNGLNRLAAILQLEDTGKERLAEILNAIASGRARQAQDIIAEMTASIRQSNKVTPEAELTARLAAILVANVLRSDRFAQSLIAEMVAHGRLAGLTIPEQTLAERCAQILIAEAIGEKKIAQAVQGDQQASVEIANIMVALGSDWARISGLLTPEASGAERQPNIIEAFKHDLIKIAHLVSIEGSPSIKQAHILDALKHELTRIGNIAIALGADSASVANLAFVEKPGTQRQAHISEVVKNYLIRIAGILNVQTSSADKQAHIIDTYKSIFEKIANAVIALGSGYSQIAGILFAQATASEKQAHLTDVLKHELARVAHGVISQATIDVRIPHLLTTDKTASNRVAMLLGSNKTMAMAVANLLDFSGIAWVRLMNFLQTEMISDSRLRQELMTEKPSSFKIANILLKEVATFARLAAALVPQDTETVKIANRLAMAGMGEDILAQILTTDKIVSDRIAHALAAEITTSAQIYNLLNPNVSASERQTNLLLVESLGRSRLSQLVPTYGRTVSNIAHLAILTRGQITLPDGRTIFIDEEIRLVLIESSTRSIVVPASDRTIEIDHEDRIIEVPYEDRDVEIE